VTANVLFTVIAMGSPKIKNATNPANTGYDGIWELI